MQWWRKSEAVSVAVDVALDCGAPPPKQQREASASAHDDDGDDEAILVSFQVWFFC
jgi:hypothetical protein